MPKNQIGFISDEDIYLFKEGTHYQIYKKLGAHILNENDSNGVHFALWAPHAANVSVVGNFNSWNPYANMMKNINLSGIWSLFIPNIENGELYKFAIHTYDGRILYKSDPYATSFELRPKTASIVHNDPYNYNWSDYNWLRKRKLLNIHERPLSIYECHLGSWKKDTNSKEHDFLNYKDLAVQLAGYIKYMGYTHVELIGISEHPLDASWGYQVSGYYAPTSRYGFPEDFQFFVNYMHMNDIGVILDWVPAHFPKDDFALSLFDGEPLYEYSDPRKGEHPDWGTKVFDYSKNEVKCFLIANALYWINEFHLDGLRVDAVASMLYLDYGRNSGEWIPNIYGENKNLEAIEFFKHLNSIIEQQNNGVMIIAEESTAWPLVTKSVQENGLGFTFKWNMGWMHDFLEYMKLDPYFRKYNHNKLTFAMTYAHSENFILVLSHDEVVHLKCSMIEKMPGLYHDKFSNLKCAYTFLIGHPGKKLLFMGQDFAQHKEWNENVSLDWHLCNESSNKDIQNFFRDLLHMYKEYPCLYEIENNWDGFKWINPNDADRSIFSFIRYSLDKSRALIFVISFTPVERRNFCLGVPQKCNLKLILDEKIGLYSRADKISPIYKSVDGESDNQPYHITYDLAPYGISVFELVK